ncbi:hypothetical protein EH240_35115 [Mesorhizobium tamadayense]|uniref:Uncharacterized protein n=1 Tax=Mesorhizobium tamadayense TaxID=425306 RepID=A0A3P3EQ52_9HYPH|nr:redoxin domain-containing protein [Mesorhizobium tamadayense]RRH88361.1 hypothetical protein EH240_35115 [Mesorhizobium tamadayense]
MPIYNHPDTDTDKTRYQYSAQIAGSGAGWRDGRLAFFALPVLEGHRVGDKIVVKNKDISAKRIADISGKDQLGNDVTLSKYSNGQDWILIDICAQWCGPCNFAAQKMRDFLDSINGTKGRATANTVPLPKSFAKRRFLAAVRV